MCRLEPPSAHTSVRADKTVDLQNPFHDTTVCHTGRASASAVPRHQCDCHGPPLIVSASSDAIGGVRKLSIAYLQTHRLLPGGRFILRSVTGRSSPSRRRPASSPMSSSLFGQSSTFTAAGGASRIGKSLFISSSSWWCGSSSGLCACRRTSRSQC